MSDAPPFDLVIVHDGPADVHYTFEQFLDVDLFLRVRWILEARIEFFLAAQPVDPATALRGLRAA